MEGKLEDGLYVFDPRFFSKSSQATTVNSQLLDLSTNLANKSHHIMKSYTILSQGNSSMFSNSFSLWHNRLRHHATPIIKSTGTVVIFQRAIKWK